MYACESLIQWNKKMNRPNCLIACKLKLSSLFHSFCHFEFLFSFWNGVATTRECSKINRNIQHWLECRIVSVVLNWYLPAFFVNSVGHMWRCYSIVLIYFHWLLVRRFSIAVFCVIPFYRFSFMVFLCTHSGKNLEYGLKEEGLLKFVKELNGNDAESYDNYLRDASMYARGEYYFCVRFNSRYFCRKKNYGDYAVYFNCQWLSFRCEVIWCESSC